MLNTRMDMDIARLLLTNTISEIYLPREQEPYLTVTSNVWAVKSSLEHDYLRVLSNHQTLPTLQWLMVDFDSAVLTEPC